MSAWSLARRVALRQNQQEAERTEPQDTQPVARFDKSNWLYRGGNGNRIIFAGCCAVYAVGVTACLIGGGVVLAWNKVREALDE